MNIWGLQLQNLMGIGWYLGRIKKRLNMDLLDDLIQVMKQKIISEILRDDFVP